MKCPSKKIYKTDRGEVRYQVGVKVQPFAYQTSHLVWKSLTGNLTSRSLEQRLFVGKASLTADRGRCLLWGNGAEGAAASSSYPARPGTGRACSEKVWPWGAPPLGSYRRRLPLPDCFPCSTPRPRTASSLTTRPAPSAHRAAHQEVLWCSR